MSKLKLIDRDKVLRRLRTLSEASAVIQRTARHMLQYYKDADEGVSLWLEALNQAVSDQARTSLFYVANEILQSKSYGSHYFRQSWKPHLGRSIDLIKDSTVNDKIRRILNIWIERKVYDKAFVEDLINRLSKTKIMDEEHCKDIIMNFEPDEAIEKLKELMHVETETSESMKKLESSITFDDKLCKDTIKKLKDKKNCNEFTDQLDTNINQLFKICSMLEEELKVREKTLELMTNAEIYYETQQSETLIVEDAYRRYGKLISKTKDALEEHIEFLMDDGGQVDIDDAPSPGKTPPHLHEVVTKSPKNSPMSFDDVVSPSQSMDMSEDDTPVDKSSFIDKPYSPSHQIHSSSSITTEPKPTLSSTEALKLLTSVFSQSLTKKPMLDGNTKVNLQSDIFRNTLATSAESKSTTNDKKEESSETAFADAFRLISNLTGLRTIGDRPFKVDTTLNSGTTIPILTSKMSYKSNDECDQSIQSQYNYNQPNFSTASISNGLEIPRMLYPDMQNTIFSPAQFNQQNNANVMYPMFNNTSIPPPPVPGLFNTLGNNPLAFSMATLNQNNQQLSRSPGSCTEDEDDGGATPTQDEPALLNSSLPVGMFNTNVLPALAAGAAEINKQIQQAMKSGTNPFNLSNMLSVQNDAMTNNPLQSSAWAGGMSGQYSFNTNMTLPFSIMNQNSQIQPTFTPVQNPSLPFGPPRAIRTKRPNAADSSSNAENVTDCAHSTGSNSQSPPTTQSVPPCEDESNNSDNQLEDLESAQSVDNHKPADNVESDVINLYGDVEEEIDRNFNLYQQTINNARNARVPPSMDRYHLYNNQVVDLQNQAYYRNNDQQQQNSPYNRPPRMNYSQNNNFSRNQSARGHMPYFPNRTTNFRPKNNYNMFN